MGAFDHVLEPADIEIKTYEIPAEDIYCLRWQTRDPAILAREITDMFYGTTEREGTSAVFSGEQGELFRFGLRRAGAKYTLDVKPVYRVQAFEDPITGETLYIR